MLPGRAHGVSPYEATALLRLDLLADMRGGSAPVPKVGSRMTSVVLLTKPPLQSSRRAKSTKSESPPRASYLVSRHLLSRKPARFELLQLICLCAYFRSNSPFHMYVCYSWLVLSDSSWGRVPQHASAARAPRLCTAAAPTVREVRAPRAPAWLSVIIVPFVTAATLRP